MLSCFRLSKTWSTVCLERTSTRFLEDVTSAVNLAKLQPLSTTPLSYRKMGKDTETSLKELQEFAQTCDGVNADPILENECYLRILLQANRMNLKKSKEALQENISWRNKLELSSLKIDDFSPELEYNIGFLTDGKSLSGGPCFYMNLKHTRFPRILKEFGYEKYVQYIAFKLKGVEKEACASNINGEPFGLSPYTVPLICDGSGFTSADMFSLKHTWTSLRACRELSNHFPMFTSTTFVYINANKWLEVTTKIAKPFLEATGLKVVVYGTNEAEWSGYIDGLVGLEQFRRFQSTAEEYDRKCDEF